MVLGDDKCQRLVQIPSGESISKTCIPAMDAIISVESGDQVIFFTESEIVATEVSSNVDLDRIAWKSSRDFTADAAWPLAAVSDGKSRKVFDAGPGGVIERNYATGEVSSKFVVENITAMWVGLGSVACVTSDSILSVHCIESTM